MVRTVLQTLRPPARSGKLPGIRQTPYVRASSRIRSINGSGSSRLMAQSSASARLAGLSEEEREQYARLAGRIQDSIRDMLQ